MALRAEATLSTDTIPWVIHFSSLCALPPPPPAPPQLPSDPRVLYDRRLSGNACSVSAFEVGRGAGLRLELTRDLVEEDAIAVQVSDQSACA